MTDAACELDPRSSREALALNTIAGIAVRPFAALAGFYRRRAMLTRLTQLDDHMLKDIGLQRFDLCDAMTLSSGEDVTRFLRGRADERRVAERGRQRMRARIAASE